MKNRYDSEQTVKDIIDVATKLFTEKGFEKTSIQDIVNGLEGLTRGAIYHHFASKDEIMIAVIRNRLPQTNSYYSDDLAGLENGKEKLRHLLMKHLSSLKEGTSNTDDSILRKNPKILVEMLRVNSEFVAPQVKLILDEANDDGSLAIENTKEVSEVLLLLISNWFFPLLYPETEKAFHSKVLVLRRILEGMGLNLLDDEFCDSMMCR